MQVSSSYLVKKMLINSSSSKCSHAPTQISDDTIHFRLRLLLKILSFYNYISCIQICDLKRLNYFINLVNIMHYLLRWRVFILRSLAMHSMHYKKTGHFYLYTRISYEVSLCLIFQLLQLLNQLNCSTSHEDQS